MDFSLIGILTIALEVLIIFFSLSVHESAHGWMADKLGDHTARMLGRITLNPIPHIDPVGTIFLPLFLAVTGMPIFGWAKPVPVISRNFKHIKRDGALVGAAGPLSNLMLVLISLFLMGASMAVLGPQRFGALVNSKYSGIWWLLQFGLINLILAVFNLIPIPPLDGSWILSAILPYRVQQLYDRTRNFSFILLLLVFFLVDIRPAVNVLVWLFFQLPLELLTFLLQGH